MEGTSSIGGATILSLAMAAGAVAFGALILRLIISGAKIIIEKIKEQ